MSDRVDELKGKVKSTVGHITGDRDLEAEGTAENTTARTAREAKGLGNEVKGNLKQAAGNIAGDSGLKAEGEADRLKGKSQQL